MLDEDFIIIDDRYACGGIGDLLQQIQSAIEAKSISVISHYHNAPEIFERFGVNVIRFEHYSEVSEIDNVFLAGKPLRRDFYPKFQDVPPPIPKTSNDIIGIHIEGSSLSNEYWKALGQPSKNMTNEFILYLLSSLHQAGYNNAYLFCAPSRKDEILSLVCPLYNKMNISIIAFHNIWNSLSCVYNCAHVIGMDSCIKTMSSILKIPTTVFVGDYSDKYRDDVFLNPYIHDGVMNVIKFKDINTITFDQFKNFIKI